MADEKGVAVVGLPCHVDYERLPFRRPRSVPAGAEELDFRPVPFEVAELQSAFGAADAHFAIGHHVRARASFIVARDAVVKHDERGGMLLDIGHNAAREFLPAKVVAREALDALDLWHVAQHAKQAGVQVPTTPSPQGALPAGGDVIVSLANVEVRDAAALEALLPRVPPGRDIPLAYLRDGERRTTSIRF